MGNRESLKGDGKALKNNGVALNFSKEVLEGVHNALKGDVKEFMGGGKG